MNMNVAKGFQTKEIERWAKKHLAAGRAVISDGLAYFSSVEKAGCIHTSITTSGGPDCVTLEEFTWVNTMIGNVKTAMIGVYHSVGKKHLPRYLAEFCYRLNLRYQLEDMLPRLGYMAMRTSPMP